MDEKLIPKDLFRTWIQLGQGWFSVFQIARGIENQQIYRIFCEDLTDDGVLERHPSKMGWYRRKVVELEPMNYMSADISPVDLWLPWGLPEMVEIYPGNVIMIAGAKSSGKTASMLNIARENVMKGWNVRYFNSEMSEIELSKRIRLMPEFKAALWSEKGSVEFFKRYRDFHDVIDDDPKTLNIVDFLQIHDEFYGIGASLFAIHEALAGRAVAIVCIQKNPGQDTGLGGYRSIEVSRLYLALDKGRVKIVDAKNWVDPAKNPNGLVREYKLWQGSKIITDHPWYKSDATDI